MPAAALKLVLEFFLRSGLRTFRRVLLLAACAPAVQIFFATMRALDRGQRIVELSRRFAAGRHICNCDDEPA